MASSNIKLFDENKGNMLSDSEFNISNQRLNGLQTGVASSQLQNKAMYQASLVAYAIAQIMMQNGLNANDTDAVSAFVANLSGTMLQKVYDIATTAEAQAGVATGKWMSPALVKAAIDYKFANAVTFGNTVTLSGDPTENLQAATKQYVDGVKVIKNYSDGSRLIAVAGKVTIDASAYYASLSFSEYLSSIVSALVSPISTSANPTVPVVNNISGTTVKFYHSSASKATYPYLIIGVPN